MGNSNNQKSNWKEVSSILHESQQGYFYHLSKYDSGILNSENKKGQVRYQHQPKYFGNEIFACCLVAAIFIINIGGSGLIRNRTKQQLIYSTTLQTSHIIRQ
ncbi:hypothetical protein NIES267_54510 [Calothrix parasitica NIES-267]|uniref:Uncharacterized protein n=1 Tax=Calothrix parasitica NIES-267 TaxID=1973488 RepID=A0A1Z4LXG2_9CYAN|nr:hypothetical protein NIES267_54510 [Calothrix parasitica NIES-267]